MDFNYVILPTIHVYNMCIKFLNNWSQKQYGIFVSEEVCMETFTRFTSSLDYSYTK